MKLYINYNLGKGNMWVNVNDLEEAKDMADENATYTQKNITIEDLAGNVLLQRKWWNFAYTPLDGYDEDAKPLEFGELGYYSDWS